MRGQSAKEHSFIFMATGKTLQIFLRKSYTPCWTPFPDDKAAEEGDVNRLFLTRSMGELLESELSLRKDRFVYISLLFDLMRILK